MFDSGYRLRSARNIPFPTMWFGRHAKGWAQMMFGHPCSIMSTISAVKYQPSPAWLPRRAMSCERGIISPILRCGSNLPPVAANALRTGASYLSSAHSTSGMTRRWRPPIPRFAWSHSAVADE